MKDKICIFAGTTEGRQLAALLHNAARVSVCVATEYGEIMLDGIDGVKVRTGRMDETEMARFFAEERFSRVIDATHPYAALATENIAAAANTAGVPVLRVLRETDRAVPNAVYVGSSAEARDYLQNKTGNILVATGAKELPAYMGLDMSRVWARVLPLASSLETCEKAGIPTAHIIAQQGPFSYETNLALLRAISAKYIVTKSSGKNGGFEEKIEAAQTAGAVPVIVGAPPQTRGLCLDDAIRELQKTYELQDRSICLIGIGPGGADYLTAQAKTALESCDAVIGAQSVLRALSTRKPCFAQYQPQQIAELLETHPSIRRPAIVLRGDTGFFSGAKKLLELFGSENVTVIPGLASPVAFAAKLGVSWDDARLTSMHGRELHLIRTVAGSKKTFVLTGGGNTPDSIFRKLCDYGMGSLVCAVGERLSCPDEKITRGNAESLKDKTYDPLSVVYIENGRPETGMRLGIPDEAYVRGDVPMTKEEVRAVSVAKLALNFDSVVWDIGAGTGSVSVACALASPSGSVYAVEKAPEGIDLIQQNKIKFKTDNLYEIKGAAPEALAELPVPTHVFIGGSGGRLNEILTFVFEKNPTVTVVLNAVTLETQAEILNCAKRLPLSSFEAVSVSVARARQTGGCHLAAAQNPVWIYTLRGGVADG